MIKYRNEIHPCKRCGITPISDYGKPGKFTTARLMQENPFTHDLNEIIPLLSYNPSVVLICPKCHQYVEFEYGHDDQLVAEWNRRNPIQTDKIFKEDIIMNIGNEMGKLFAKLETGMCRLSIDGKIALKTNDGYKTFNPETGRLVNCNSFVFELGDDMFFCVPTNHVKTGDIILIGGKPRCVIEADHNQLTVLNYETNAVETILPERHMFMGNMYFYSKIFSPFGNTFSGGRKSNSNMMMKFFMMSEIMKGFGGGSGTGSGMNMGNMMAMSMLMGNNNGGMLDMFSGIFDDDEDLFDDGDSEPAEPYPVGFKPKKPVATASKRKPTSKKPSGKSQTTRKTVAATPINKNTEEE